MRSVGEFSVLETNDGVQRPAVHLESAKNALPRPTPNAALTLMQLYYIVRTLAENKVTNRRTCNRIPHLSCADTRLHQDTPMSAAHAIFIGRC